MRYEAACWHCTYLPADGGSLSEESKLLLYSLHQQATVVGAASPPVCLCLFKACLDLRQNYGPVAVGLDNIKQQAQQRTLCSIAERSSGRPSL